MLSLSSSVVVVVVVVVVITTAVLAVAPSSIMVLHIVISACLYWLKVGVPIFNRNICSVEFSLSFVIVKINMIAGRRNLQLNVGLKQWW